MIGKDKARVNITVPIVQLEQIRKAAAALGISVSAFFMLAAVEKLRRDSRKKSD